MDLESYLKTTKIRTADFAELVGVTPTSITRYLAGTRHPEWDVIHKIHVATAAKVTADDWAKFRQRRGKKKAVARRSIPLRAALQAGVRRV